MKAESSLQNVIVLSDWKCECCKLAWMVHQRPSYVLYEIDGKQYCIDCEKNLTELEDAEAYGDNPSDIRNWIKFEVWFEDFRCDFECQNNIDVNYKPSQAFCGQILIIMKNADINYRCI